MEEKLNQLKLEKQTMLEKANLEKRDLTEEEKKRGFEIDQQIYQLKNNQNINPTDLVKTNVKIDMGAPLRAEQSTVINQPQVNNSMTEEVNVTEKPVVNEPLNQTETLLNTVQENQIPAVEDQVIKQTVSEEPQIVVEIPEIEPTVIENPVSNASVQQTETPVLNNQAIEQTVSEEPQIVVEIPEIEPTVIENPVSNASVQPTETTVNTVQANQTPVIEQQKPVVEEVNNQVIQSSQENNITSEDVSLNSQNTIEEVKANLTEEVGASLNTTEQVLNNTPEPLVEEIKETNATTPIAEEEKTSIIEETAAIPVSEVEQPINSNTQDTTNVQDVKEVNNNEEITPVEEAKVKQKSKTRTIITLILFIIVLILAGVLVYLNM